MFLNPDIVVSQFGLEPGMRVGDFGSGSGHLAVIMAQKVGKEGKISAIDVLEDKLDSVRVLAKAAGLENIETIRANLEVIGSSGLADKSQDVVVLANILFQSDKKEEILQEAKRVLKDNGRLIVIDWKKGGGGLGPPDDLRTDEEILNELVAKEGFSREKTVDAGQFHYGNIFKNAAG